MEKQTKITIGLILGFLVFVILHNIIYAIFGVEEPVFFSLALLSGLGFMIVLLKQILGKIIQKIKKL